MVVRNFKKAVNHILKLEQVHGLIKFNEKYWLKLYTDSNTEFQRNPKDDFEKDSFKLVNNSVFGKTMEIRQKHRNIKLVSNNKKEIIWYLSQTTI